MQVHFKALEDTKLDPVLPPLFKLVKLLDHASVQLLLDFASSWSIPDAGIVLSL